MSFEPFLDATPAEIMKAWKNGGHASWEIEADVTSEFCCDCLHVEMVMEL